MNWEWLKERKAEEDVEVRTKPWVQETYRWWSTQSRQESDCLDLDNQKESKFHSENSEKDKGFK